MATLMMLHCPANTGYAIRQHEEVFFDAACLVEGSRNRVHFSYQVLDGNHPETLPGDFTNLLEHDYVANPPSHLSRLQAYCATHGIRRALAFDLSPGNPTITALRRGGVARIVAYHGAPVGTPRGGLVLLAKRLKLLFEPSADHYVFQSESMRDSGVRGRGLDPAITSVVRSGLDTDAYRPGLADRSILQEKLGIPQDRFVVFYSGHMEPRKGVWVLVETALEMVDGRGIRDIHFLLCGNQPGEAERYLETLAGSEAAGHVTFGGYRDDVAELMSASDLGVIASTGWDSFTRSALEMASSGLPMVVSDTGGLPETVVEGRTGFVVPAGDSCALADMIVHIKADPALRAGLGAAAREMALERYPRERQVQALAALLRAG